VQIHLMYFFLPAVGPKCHSKINFLSAPAVIYDGEAFVPWCVCLYYTFLVVAAAARDIFYLQYNKWERFLPPMTINLCFLNKIFNTQQR
jgi:hypothetical protein